MAIELILAPEAQADIQQAYDWYEDQRIGLGERYLVAVDATMQSIVRIPEFYEIVHAVYRRALIRKFPYAVFYEYTGFSALVYSVCHTARDPEKWRRRLI